MVIQPGTDGRDPMHGPRDTPPASRGDRRPGRQPGDDRTGGERGATRAASVLRYCAFGGVALFCLIGALFLAGEVLTDPGGWTGAGLTAAWLVPTVALIAYVLRRPEPAATLLIGLTVLAAGVVVLDAGVALMPRDEVGPVAAIGVFALLAPVAVLGLRRPALAGTLLLVLGAAQIAGLVITFALREAREGPTIGQALTTSSGVLVTPLVIAGALFVASAAIGRTR